MTASEAARHDLYNGLNELLGPERAETLMAALPAYDTSELVTKSDLAVLGAELRSEISGLRTELRSEMADLRTEFRTEIGELRTDIEGGRTSLGSEISELRFELRGEISLIGARFATLDAAIANLQEGQAAIHLRLDRLFLALIGGLIVIVGVMAGVVFMP